MSATSTSPPGRPTGVLPAEVAPPGAPTPAAAHAVLGPLTPFLTVLATVHRAQLSRTKVARIPLLFVATFQSIGILVLLRGIIDTHSFTTRQSAVAGATVLVVAFVALNLLAQYVGTLKATRALDYYMVLPISPAAVVLGVAAAYAAFTLPGAVVTAAVGAGLFHLPFGNLWILVAVAPLAGASLAGIGALIGLLAPRQELATLAGQLGMTAVLFLDIIPASRLPAPLSWIRDALPSSYATDALADCFVVRVDWASVVADLGVCALVGVVALAVSTRVFRRTARR